MNRTLLTAVALASAPLLAAGFASPAMATIELQLTSGASTTGIIVGAGGTVKLYGAVGGGPLIQPVASACRRPQA